MRRFLKAPALFTAGLALFLAGCSGDSPTSPSGPSPSGGGGTCAVTVTLTATTVTPLAGTAITVRATVTRNGVTVPDGSSVSFVTDFGFFNENGLQTVVKIVSNGFADVTLGALSAGTAHVKALFDCGQGSINVAFTAIPDTTAPFISTITPSTGSCAGGDTITIDGGNFGNDATTTRVLFGGAPGSVVSVSNIEIKVKTPSRTLTDPQVPEQVDVVVTIGPGAAARSTTKTKAFTYTCVTNRVFISTVVPSAGSPSGGETVVVNGGNFGTNVATTRVTFCGTSAQIMAQSGNAITVTTPRHVLANPAVSEVCDVSVTVDLGLVSQQAAVLPNGFTYRGSGGGGGGCNSDPGFFAASLSPNTGPPDGGTIVTINGGGFGTVASNLRVDFGTTQAAITAVTPTTITVSTPRHTLANPDLPETVDVTVTDLGSASQRCARVTAAFTYTGLALEPVIYSVSPRTGPNDASTRVTIFGTGFQFPMQVFLTGGTCGSQLVEATLVGPVTLNTLVFNTPVAANANVCLANQLLDVVVLNPLTGKKATCPGCFKYYPCPQITTIAPGFGPYFGGTRVEIVGFNFEERATGGSTVAWSFISVSSSTIVALTTPVPVNGCADISAPVLINSTALSCPNAVGPIWTYQVKSISPIIRSIVPQTIPQAGGVLVTVNGDNFFDNMRVVLKLPQGAPRNIVPTILSTTQLTFTAPAFAGSFLTQSCLIGTTTGTQNVDTPVELDVVNVATTCQAVDQLIYHPADTDCHIASAALAISTTSLPDATNGVPYGATLIATGGTPPYHWSIVAGSLPTGMDPLSDSGAITGTPTVSATFAFTVQVMDSATPTAATKTANLSIKVNP